MIVPNKLGQDNIVIHKTSNFHPWLDGFCEKHVLDSEILLIGTGGGTKDYYAFPNYLTRNRNPKSIEYLEIFVVYWQELKNLDYSVTLGDVRDIKRIFKDRMFDVIVWSHGPEHVKKKEMSKIFKDIISLTRKAVLLVVPYGSFWDKQWNKNDNPYETHIQKNLTPESFDNINGFNFEVFGTKDKQDAQMFMWKEI